MSITIPAAPDNLVWNGTETFGDCKYVYVRLESHAIAFGAHPKVVDMMTELHGIHNKGLRETGHGAYALLVNPWVAEQIKAHGNALMFGVTRSGAVMDEVRSRHWTPIRTADQSAIIR
ncbi:hypothetical protein SEA_POKYPUPPY_63 [Gordonia phage PokyPuppy]|nr:hypothetical protein SEA_POKYPUPPY_63 [Gordonia phage PokyPuppy]